MQRVPLQEDMQHNLQCCCEAVAFKVCKVLRVSDHHHVPEPLLIVNLRVKTNAHFIIQ